jgi:hypothetical protein
VAVVVASAVLVVEAAAAVVLVAVGNIITTFQIEDEKFSNFFTQKLTGHYLFCVYP